MMRRVVQVAEPDAGRALSRHVHRAQAGRPASEASYVSQLRNRYPESAEAKAIPPGTCE